jgi:putative endonuclease
LKDKRKIGKKYEEIASQYLMQHNWKILEKNYTFHHKEVDLIIQKEDEICLVEVKYRRSDSFGEPKEFVNENKKRNIKMIAKYYISSKKLFDKNITFGIISITNGKINFERGFFQW